MPHATPIIWKRVERRLREDLSPYVDQWAWLLPDWLAELHMRPLDGHADDDSDVIACVDIGMYAYRQVTIRWSERFLLEPRDMQSKTVLHEFCHVVTAPVFTVTNKLELVAPVPELLEEAHEHVVEDLTNKIWAWSLKTA